MLDSRNVILIALAVAVCVLGYLYYDSQNRGIRIEAPGSKLEGK
jgi:hypothetical protein